MVSQPGGKGVAGLVEVWSGASRSVRLGAILGVFPDAGCEVSALKKEVYPIGCERCCCLALGEPPDPGLIFMFLPLLRQLSALRTLRAPEGFSLAEEKEEEGGLA